MGRTIKRVPLDFDWPLRKRWEGFLWPEKFSEKPCEDCGQRGYTPVARRLEAQWWGKIAFRPEENGSTPHPIDHPSIVAFASRNLEHAPEYYGRGPLALERECRRLAALWNGMWMHHLNDHDVADLIAGDRLYEFTSEIVKGKGWVRRESFTVPTAAEVNAWSMTSFAGMSGGELGTLIEARCKRAGIASTCPACEGRGSVERYPGQRAESEEWTSQKPPTGDGWQLWETVTEGSPVSPVFPTAESLAQWLTTTAGGEAVGPSGEPLTIEQARRFVAAGWAPSGVVDDGEFVDGARWIGSMPTPQVDAPS